MWKSSITDSLHPQLAMKSSSSSLSNFSMVLLVFFSSSLLLLINNKASHRQSETVGSALEPINFIVSRVSAIVMAYLSFMVYHGIHPSLENLHRGLQKSWKQTTITMMYIELLNTASASLLLMLASLGRSAEGAASEIAVIAGAVFLISWLAPLLFMHSDAACKISLIVSVAEEGCKGERALERASELVKERKVVGFSLMVLTVIIDHAVSKMCRFGSAISLVQLLPMFFTYLVYTSFYYDSKKKYCLKGEKIL
ncbi:hypothetical protein KSP40_PGU010153 [Platanthera guangdongensis]|uniref:Uncharacterized protein n=2 Tax=Platanthera guangdongensis TaxID=2320717 RepID=A0ABR2MYG5_9ASPA